MILPFSGEKTKKTCLTVLRVKSPLTHDSQQIQMQGKELVFLELSTGLSIDFFKRKNNVLLKFLKILE